MPELLEMKTDAGPRAGASERGKTMASRLATIFHQQWPEERDFILLMHEKLSDCETVF